MTILIYLNYTHCQPSSRVIKGHHAHKVLVENYIFIRINSRRQHFIHLFLCERLSFKTERINLVNWKLPCVVDSLAVSKSRGCILRRPTNCFIKLYFWAFLPLLDRIVKERQEKIGEEKGLGTGTRTWVARSAVVHKAIRLRQKA